MLRCKNQVYSSSASFRTMQRSVKHVKKPTEVCVCVCVCVCMYVCICVCVCVPNPEGLYFTIHGWFTTLFLIYIFCLNIRHVSVWRQYLKILTFKLSFGNSWCRSFIHEAVLKTDSLKCSSRSPDFNKLRNEIITKTRQAKNNCFSNKKL